MAKKSSVGHPAWVRKLQDALGKALVAASNQAVAIDWTIEKVSGTNLYRFVVRSAVFDKMTYSERQVYVWRIAQTTLGPEGSLLISMIVTLGRSEAAVA